MDATAITSDWVGQVVDDNFPLVEWLGGSGASGVFLTQIEGPRAKKAAIKLIPAEGADAEARLARWAATMKLSHPHLMRVFRTGRCRLGGGGQIYVVTDYAEEILSQVIPERPITTGEALEMLRPVLDALSYLHRSGFVHGHLKPSNILVVDNQVKLSGDNLCVAGRYRKNPAALTVYDAPELARATVAAPADLWSLGVTLVEALTQHTEFEISTSGDEPLLPASIAQPFADIVRNCLVVSPSRRWNLDNVSDRLDAFRAVPVPFGREQEKPSSRIRRAPVIAGALVVIAAAALLLSRPRHPQPPPPAPGAAAQPAAHSVPQAAAQADSAQPAATAGTGATQPAAAAASSPPAPPPTAPTAASQPGTLAGGDVAERVLPDVPAKARGTIQGKVDVAVRVAVDAQGNVLDASLASPGPSKYFADLAVEASRKWKFQPAQGQGGTVPSAWILHYHFRSSGTEVVPVQSSP